jgi:hypothetical protein
MGRCGYRRERAAARGKEPILMGVDNRTWRTQGLAIVGEASDGRPSKMLTAQLLPGVDVDEERRLTVLIVALLNRETVPQRREELVYNAVLSLHEETGKGTSAAAIAELTGLHRSTAGLIVERLDKQGLVVRGEPGKGGRRPANSILPSTS